VSQLLRRLNPIIIIIIIITDLHNLHNEF